MPNNIGRYLAVAGLVAYFGACTSEDRKFGANGNAAAGQANGIGGGPSGKTGGVASSSGGAAGAAQLMVVKVPCKGSTECDDKNPCNGAEICTAGFCAAEGMNKDNSTQCAAPMGALPVSAAGAGNVGGAGGAGGSKLMSPSNEFFCTKGSCVRGYCGDGYIDTAAGEECDDMNTDDKDGCRKDCQFTCKTTQECDNGNFCDGAEICLPDTHKCATGVKPAQNTLCNPPDNTKWCNFDTCVLIGCGNGNLDADKGEECDDGNVTPNDGCEVDCKWTCKDDADCGDKNACNGVETCDKTNPQKPICKPGTPVTCPAQDACHQSLCKPADGSCDYPLIDADNDRESSTALGTCGTDCDDNDPAIFSKNQEVCKDGKDNDCNPATPDDTSSTRYYLDCDGDGYSGSTDYITECNPPPPKAGLCPPGSANHWITLAPDPINNVNWDCGDTEPLAHPGQTQYSTRSFVNNIKNESWDYDCDGVQSQEAAGTNANPNAACDPANYACEAGYTGPVAAACGNAAPYTYCGSKYQYIDVVGAPIRAQASTILLPPIYFDFCPDKNATTRYNYDRTQACR